LVDLDPDAIIVLTLRERASDADLAPYRTLTTLRAVRENRVMLVAAPEAYVTGPRVLAFVDRLSPVVQRLRKRE
jgi:ABC-type Fe3+-hydroxamate transport system substrate-binding protein